MKKLRFAVFFLTLVLAASFALSCGASQGQNQLQSITLSPATADAQNYPDGQVQFTATGYYGNPSHTVTPLSATWSACQENMPTTAVTVTKAGAAQCANGATGTYSVFAADPDTRSGVLNCPATNACGGGCIIVGTAQLTCP
jgi:hypothetical protein